MRRKIAGAAVAAVVLVSGAAFGAGKEPAKKGDAAAEKSLYERLGGAYPIAVVVDDFIDRVVADPVLNANPAIAGAREHAPPAGLKFHVTTLVCQVTGGPCKYVGRDMKTAHAHLNISEKEWQALGADFKASLDKFKVPEKEQKELFAIVESTKGDIVTAGAAKGTK